VGVGGVCVGVCGRGGGGVGVGFGQHRRGVLICTICPSICLSLLVSITIHL